MKITNEFKAGVLGVTAILLVIFGYNYLKGENLFEQSRNFYVVYDNVKGLSQSSEITINGLRVGTVSDIKFLNNSGKVLVTLSIDNDFKFSKKSVAKIYGGDFIGGKSMAIVPDYSVSEMAQTGDTLTGRVEEGLVELVNEKLTPLQEKMENALVKIDTMLTSINQVFDYDTRESLKSSVIHLDQALVSFRNTTEEANMLVKDNKDKFSETLNNFNKTSENFVSISDTLANSNIKESIANLSKTLDNLNSLAQDLEQGEGTMGKFLKDDQLYDNLEASTKELEELLEDMKLNPKRYVHFSIFGKKNKAYKETED
ncbi:MlaD family protein [Psychroflexus planctonicus]|uniref:Organic solvent ABC transporter substrate-binding protein n=1 Tax=Psychroflexus planctonicus TaxID=1526575 RepID=A0ABQ1SC51_9FLAO|nr:MlaD family protein [Psychroflexus planctonicus]GGE27030.1 organic solvent ABC transporter substrate-binding protein [Psychroflexus planctonicus]